MKMEDARRWLGIYFLLFTAILGAYMLIFSETPLLPISKSEAQDAFQIVVPVFLGQVTIIFQWITANLGNDKDATINVPSWVIRMPPIIAVCIVGAACMALVLANLNTNGSTHWRMSPEIFKNAVTFAVSILNASTIFLVAKIFPQTKLESPDIPATGASAGTAGSTGQRN
jgi:hypothetical protein